MERVGRRMEWVGEKDGVGGGEGWGGWEKDGVGGEKDGVGGGGWSGGRGESREQSEENGATRRRPRHYMPLLFIYPLYWTCC